MLIITLKDKLEMLVFLLEILVSGLAIYIIISFIIYLIKELQGVKNK